jgi:hypothetical protein
MRRFMLRAVATCVTFAVGVSSCVAVRSRDLPDPGDADLLPTRVDLRPEEDGYPALRRAINELSYPTEDRELFGRVRRTLRGEAGLDAQLEGMVVANRAALDQARQALAASRLRLPALEPAEEVPRVRFQLLARLLSLEAHRDALQGRTLRSIRAHLDAIALGHLLETAEGATLLDVMIGLSIKSIASESLRGSLSRIEIAPEESRSGARELALYHSSPEAWSRMWSEEYRTTKKNLLTTWATTSPVVDVSLHPLSWLPASYAFQPNRTLESYAAFIRTRQKVSSLPCARMPSDAALMSPKGWNLLHMALDRNGAGNVLVALATPNFARFQVRRCLGNTSLAATQALFGLRAYQREHRDLPEDLKALVPRYLESLPRDGFDDEVLRYSSSSRWLHSPGSDRVDRGGDAEDRESDDFAREPTYLIRF